MTKQGPIRAASLLERAAEVYDFGAALRRHDSGPRLAPEYEPVSIPALVELQESYAPTPATARQSIDRDHLAAGGFIVPGAPVGPIAEEFRLVKRQLLLNAEADPAARTILVCSAQPDEGKTFCAINLALSIASEREVEVVLIDADFAKPDVMTQLGLETGVGFMDALVDPQVDIERCVIATDVPRLSVLPAGRRAVNDTEYLASARTAAIIETLLAIPGRILIFDSPPALAASPASVLALNVGQALMVVRADRTSETDLREVLGVLGGCATIQLLINDVSYAPGGRRFGTYYGRGE